MENEVFISIGSNLGDRVSNCKKAIDLLSRDKDRTVVKRRSSFYETEPWGRAGQPGFVNCVVEIRTPLTPVELLKFLKDIERRLGRTPGESWGPRVVDLDIIFFGREVIESEALTVPHPHAHERAFVMTPLSEIAPGFTHPVLKKSVSEIQRDLGSEGVRKLDEVEP